MRFEGTLSRWNGDRGFGFIMPTHGDQEIFVHISAFPKDGVQPTLGEKLSFEIETDNSGKKRAKNLLCPQRLAVSRAPPSRSSLSYRRKEKPLLFQRVISLLILVVLGSYAYGEYARRVSTAPMTAFEPELQTVSTTYRCDERTHCSQMTSCAEAKYFLRNCPGVRMDGNHDGVPCEEQWCTSPIAR